jgi:polyisoprenoid-binding protein YceI
MPLYQIDPAHSGAAFKVRHLMIAHVKGEFTKIRGTVNFDEAKPFESSIEVTIDTASIHTREEKRDEHLRSADFFDAAKFPTITFKSKGVAAAGKDTYEVAGDLTIHGVTQQVAFVVDGVTPEAKDPWGGFRRGASASLTINRKDYGLVWNAPLEAGGWMIGEEVHITLDIELVRQPS